MTNTFKVTITFKATRVIRNTEGMHFWENCSRFGSSPGPKTYFISWNGVTADSTGNALIGARDTLVDLVRALPDLRHEVISSKVTAQ
jgi:hypothetical protein